MGLSSKKMLGILMKIANGQRALTPIIRNVFFC